ncbi:hypothetical protein Trco_002285 [Trichoderma cornu-damae]|uniref:Uncharacterized protein n=1 Tax=Trichoderma cornu-damae TaxID=654480 RepID=A0A9P8QPJ5_9HYPO|nr:hypothetical protein Trco_002285 [Trichoderma cornu-damae]
MSGPAAIDDDDDAAAAAAAACSSSTSPAQQQQQQQTASTSTAASAESPDDLPPFEPIFTLLTNATTNTTVHPRVHYLFSDDDASAVLTAPPSGPLHRALVVDLAPPAAPDGRWTVSSASSLTPDFAVTASRLSLQQHGNGSGNGSGNGNGSGSGSETDAGSTSVMLRVEGVEREAVDSAPSSLPGSGSGIVARDDVELLADDFKRRMAVLRKVVDQGRRRRDAPGSPHHEARPDAGHDDAAGSGEPERRGE